MLAERSGMPARRTVIERAASAIGTSVQTEPTSAGDPDGVGRRGLIERSQRHCPRRGDRRKAETNSKRRCSKHFHGSVPFLVNSPRRSGFWFLQKTRAVGYGTRHLTSNGGASADGASADGASGGDASPNDGGANPSGDGANACGGPNEPPRA
jgi:hypothetical protein